MPNPALNPTGRFSRRVEFYLRSRPKYPAALLQFFQKELGLARDDVMADIGCGTGLLTELFVRNGNLVYGVEPNQDMRRAGISYLHDFPNFRSIDAAAESTGLAANSVRFITAGQAFHWFDPARAREEFRRILEPRGIVALIWNHRRPETPFNRDYQKLIEEFETDHRAVQADSVTAEENQTLRQFFGPAGFHIRLFDNPQRLTRAGLEDRLASASYLPLPSDPRYPAMMQAANRLFAAHERDGAVEIAHDTKLYYGAL